MFLVLLSKYDLGQEKYFIILNRPTLGFKHLLSLLIFQMESNRGPWDTTQLLWPQNHHHGCEINFSLIIFYRKKCLRTMERGVRRRSLDPRR